MEFPIQMDEPGCCFQGQWRKLTWRDVERIINCQTLEDDTSTDSRKPKPKDPDERCWIYYFWERLGLPTEMYDRLAGINHPYPIHFYGYDTYKSILLSEIIHIYAAKSYPSENLCFLTGVLNEYSESMEKKIYNRIRIQTKFNHSHVEYLYGTFSEDDRTWFITPLHRGTVRDMLEQREKALGRKHHTMSETVIATILKQALRGLHYLHCKGVIHRDLSCKDLTINFEGKISIQGFIEMVEMNRDGSTSEEWGFKINGNEKWLAPEILKMKASQTYNQAVDIWSVGVLVIEMVTGIPPPTPDATIRGSDVLYTDVINGTFSMFDGLPAIKGISYGSELTDFVANCFQEDPKTRYSAKELLRHPFIKKFSKRRNKVKEELYFHPLIQQQLTLQEEVTKLFFKFFGKDSAFDDAAMGSVQVAAEAPLETLQEEVTKLFFKFFGKDSAFDDAAMGSVQVAAEAPLENAAGTEAAGGRVAMADALQEPIPDHEYEIGEGLEANVDEGEFLGDEEPALDNEPFIEVLQNDVAMDLVAEAGPPEPSPPKTPEPSAESHETNSPVDMAAVAELLERVAIIQEECASMLSNYSDSSDIVGDDISETHSFYEEMSKISLDLSIGSLSSLEGSVMSIDLEEPAVDAVDAVEAVVNGEPPKAENSCMEVENSAVKEVNAVKPVGNDGDVAKAGTSVETENPAGEAEGSKNVDDKAVAGSSKNEESNGSDEVKKPVDDEAVAGTSSGQNDPKKENVIVVQVVAECSKSPVNDYAQPGTSKAFLEAIKKAEAEAMYDAIESESDEETEEMRAHENGEKATDEPAEYLPMNFKPLISFPSFDGIYAVMDPQDPNFGVPLNETRNWDELNNLTTEVEVERVRTEKEKNRARNRNMARSLLYSELFGSTDAGNVELVPVGAEDEELSGIMMHAPIASRYVEDNVIKPLQPSNKKKNKPKQNSKISKFFGYLGLKRCTSKPKDDGNKFPR